MPDAGRLGWLPRRVVVVGGATVASVALLVAAAGALLAGPSPPGPAPAVSVGTARVVRMDVVQRQEIDGTLGFAGSFRVVTRVGGIVTASAAPGTVLRRGAALYEVDGLATRLLYGNRPAWRSLQAGVLDGPDVRQLEENLVALGYGPGLHVDDHFSVATAVAVRRWQVADGVRPTGTLPIGRVAFLPGAIRVSQVDASAGAVVEPGMPILAGSSTRTVVTAMLDPAAGLRVRPGDRVGVFLPNGDQIGGRVSAVSRTAVRGPPDAGSGAQAQAGGGGAAAPATVTVTVTLTGHPPVDLDQAPVRVAIVTATRLLARPGGGYDVEVADPAGRRRLPVTAGLFDDTSGVVEISGAGIRSGLTVEVPLG